MVMEDEFFPLVLASTFVFSLVCFLWLLRPAEDEQDLAEEWDAKASTLALAMREAPERPKRSSKSPLIRPRGFDITRTKTESSSSSATTRAARSDSSGTESATNSPGPVAFGRESMCSSNSGRRRRSESSYSTASEPMLIQPRLSAHSSWEDAPESETAADAPDAKDSDKSDAQASDKKRSPLIRSKTCLVLSPQAQSTTPLTTFTTPPLKSGRRHQRPTRPGDDQPREPKTPVPPFSPSTSRMRPTKPSATSSLTRSASALFASESGADGVSSPMRGDRRSVQAKCPRQSSGSRFYSHWPRRSAGLETQRATALGVHEGGARVQFRQELTKDGYEFSSARSWRLHRAILLLGFDC